MSPEKMVRMANQIATFFESQPVADQSAPVAAHLNDFWEPSMRVALADYVEAGGTGLHPLVLQAVDKLRLPVS